MTAVRIEHAFDCDEKTFWEQIFFSEQFNRDMYLKYLQFKQWEVTEYRETDTSIFRTVTVTPKIGDLPGAIKSLIGDNLGYREEGKFDKQSRRFSVVVVPSSLADKISVRGDTWLQPLDQVRHKRIFDAEVSVKMFGVGNIIEKKIIADLQLSYNAGAVFTADYLRRLNRPK